jgi:Clp amino terminal domain, pathogenicity island component
VRRPDIADLVMIAARVLDVDPSVALDMVELPAAEAALAGARRCGGRDPAQRAAAMLMGLVQHRPLPRANQRLALLAALGLLAERGYDLDLEPPTAARDLFSEIATGEIDQAAVTAWIASRLRARDAGCPPKETSMLERITGRRRHEPGPAGHPFSRFTKRARHVVELAQEEARLLGHNYVGTEHLLLGLLQERDGVAARALEQVGMTVEGVRSEVEAIVGRGSYTPSGAIPFTPRAKKVLGLAVREARRLSHRYVGTEHVLLGLLREGEGLAAMVLTRSRADRSHLVEAVMQILGGPSLAAAERRELIMTELAAVFDENQRLHAENDRLRALLREHGIEPDAESRSA